MAPIVYTSQMVTSYDFSYTNYIHLQLNQIPIKLEPPFNFFDTVEHGDYATSGNLHDNKVSC